MIKIIRTNAALLLFILIFSLLASCGGNEDVPEFEKYDPVFVDSF